MKFEFIPYFLLFVLFPLTAYADPIFFRLPENDREAERMLLTGEMDSTLWEKLEPFYNMPISVPEGQLYLLEEIFPELSSVIKNITLADYHPWGTDQTRQFLADYPELAHFKPVLSFDATPLPHWARIESRLYKTDLRPNPAANINLTLQPVSSFNARGSFVYSDTGAAWKRRGLNLKFCKSAKIDCGNFSSSISEGLCYGFFPEKPLPRTAVENWIYPESNSWNGLNLQVDGLKTAEADLIIHKRPNEQIIGLEGRLTKRNNFLFTLGASQLDTSYAETLRDTYQFRYLHSGGDFSLRSTKFGIHYSIHTETPRNFPVKAFLHSKNGRTSFRADYIRFPRDFPAPLSRYKHDFLSKLGNAADWNKLSTQFRYSKGISHRYAVAYYFSDTNANLDLFLGFSTENHFRFSMQIHPALSGTEEFQRYSAELKDIPLFSVKLRNSLQHYRTANGYSSNTTRMYVTYTFYERAAEISPFISGYTNSDNRSHIHAGLIQKIILFKKTGSECLLEVPLVSEGYEEFTISIRAFFFI